MVYCIQWINDRSEVKHKLQQKRPLETLEDFSLTKDLILPIQQDEKQETDETNIECNQEEERLKNEIQNIMVKE